MEYEVFLAPTAEKGLNAVPRKFRVRILDALEGLRVDPRPRGTRKLKGTDDLWRLRVGQYRVIYTIRDAELTVLVVRVAHRKDSYKGL
jgi:mRNA interferase RelE/StbE